VLVTRCIAQFSGSEPPGEGNDNEREKGGTDCSDEENPKEDFVHDCRQTSPLIDHLCGGVVAVVACSDTPQS